MDWTEPFRDLDWGSGALSAAVGLISVLLTNSLTWLRFRRAYRLDDRTQSILRRMLRDRRFRRRKFSTIQGFVPLTDEKLRAALLRAGAVRITGPNGEEFWGLLANHMDRVSPR